MTAAHTVSSVAANAASLFTHGGGIQAIAGNGPVSMQAHTDGLEILADKEITVISVNDCIEIKAKQKIALQAGQSAVTLEGGDITFACPGKFSVKGGKHLFDQRANEAAALDPLPTRLITASKEKSVESRNPQFDEQIVYKDTHGNAIADIPFRVMNKADEIQRLVNQTPTDGELDRIITPSAQPIEYALRYAEFKIKK